MGKSQELLELAGDAAKLSTWAEYYGALAASMMLDQAADSLIQAARAARQEEEQRVTGEQ